MIPIRVPERLAHGWTDILARDRPRGKTASAFFGLRTLFVLVVALLLWIVASRTQTAVTFFVPTPVGLQTITRFQGIRQQAVVGQRQYELYRVLMFATILFFGPALSAGRIATEKANKSLILVLTTPLAGWRVVFDKVLVSFCEQAEVLLAGLPVLIMIGWFGGVRLEQVVFDSLFALRWRSPSRRSACSFPSR